MIGRDIFISRTNLIGGVMVGVLASSAVDQVKSKDYKIGICCFLAKHTALWRKSKVGLARNPSVATYLSVYCC